MKNASSENKNNTKNIRMLSDMKTKIYFNLFFVKYQLSQIAWEKVQNQDII